jgi:hypothetical protein
MADGIHSRFQEIRQSLCRPFSYIHADATWQGRIAFRAGRPVSALLCAALVLFAGVFAWGGRALDEPFLLAIGAALPSWCLPRSPS